MRKLSLQILSCWGSVTEPAEPTSSRPCALPFSALLSLWDLCHHGYWPRELIINFASLVVQSPSCVYLFAIHGLQHTRLLCLSLSPRVCSNSCPSSRWCHSTISVTPFSFRPQAFWASGPFPVGQLFASGCQSIGASTSASVLPVNIQDWFPLGLTGLISLPSKVANPQCDLRKDVPFRQSLHSGMGSLPLRGLQRGFLTSVSALSLLQSHCVYTVVEWPFCNSHHCICSPDTLQCLPDPQ